MNLSWLNMGMLGVVEAGALSFLIGVIVHALMHWLVHVEGWTHAHEIAWAFLVSVAVSAGVDIWHLVYLGIVPMQSPVTIRRVLSGIHDPDYLGVRVIFEVIGALFGVMLGWVLWNAFSRRRHSSSGA